MQNVQEKVITPSNKKALGMGLILIMLAGLPGLFSVRFFGDALLWQYIYGCYSLQMSG